jgi:hypothetical protein
MALKQVEYHVLGADKVLPFTLLRVDKELFSFVEAINNLFQVL